MLRFDWKDGLLIVLGFGALATAIGGLRAAGFELPRSMIQGVAAVCVLGPSAARRFLFGPPALGELRRGFFPSLLSILGLLAIFAALAVGALLIARLSNERAPRPDFLAEERATYEGTDGLVILRDVGESQDDAAVRRRREVEERERSIVQGAAEREQQWLEREESEDERTWTLVALALGFLGFGIFGLWVRYEPVARAD